MAATSVLARDMQPARDAASMAPAPIEESPPATLDIEAEDVLATLTPRERRVLLLRFGLVDHRERSVEEVGRRLGVPGERITRIEAEALAKLSVR